MLIESMLNTNIIKVNVALKANEENKIKINKVGNVKVKSIILTNSGCFSILDKTGFKIKDTGSNAISNNLGMF